MDQQSLKKSKMKLQFKQVIKKLSLLFDGDGPTFIQQSLLVACLLFVVCFFESLRLTGCVCVVIFYLITTKSYRSTFLVGLCVLTLILPRYKTGGVMNQGRVITAYSSCFVVENNHQRMLISSKETPILDSVVQFEGKQKPVRCDHGFYAFDFNDYMKRRGVTTSLYTKTIKEVKPTNSLRGKLQMQILESFDQQTSDMLLGILLHIKPKEEIYSSFLKDSGFSYGGIIAVWYVFTRFALSKQKQRQVMDYVVLAHCIFYHFPILLVQSLIYRMVYYTPFNNKEKTGLSLCLTILVMPYCVTSAAFLIPALYKLVYCFSDHKKMDCYFYILLLQSLLFHNMNPVMTLCYGIVLNASGLCYILALIQILTKIPTTSLILKIDSYLTYFTRFQIDGSIKGFGLPMFLLVLSMLKHNKYKHSLRIAVLLCFSTMHLFHPFATFTFVNVGQGDGMVYKGAFNQEVLVFDTGKPSAYNHMKTYLQSVGVNKVDTLFISHYDLDHCGNKDRIMHDFKCDQCIDHHIETYLTKTLTIHDVNTITCEDENRSSLAHLFNFNGNTLLLMGDCDEISEKTMIRMYNNLHCDILKCSHHGSNTGSCDAFLNKVQPSFAIISSGPYSMYHHPHPDVIQRLLKRHIPYLDTYDEGDIMLVALPFTTLLVTSNGSIGFVFLH